MAPTSIAWVLVGMLALASCNASLAQDDKADCTWVSRTDCGVDPCADASVCEAGYTCEAVSCGGESCSHHCIPDDTNEAVVLESGEAAVAFSAPAAEEDGTDTPALEEKVASPTSAGETAAEPDAATANGETTPVDEKVYMTTSAVEAVPEVTAAAVDTAPEGQKVPVTTSAVDATPQPEDTPTDAVDAVPTADMVKRTFDGEETPEAQPVSVTNAEPSTAEPSTAEPSTAEPAKEAASDDAEATGTETAEPMVDDDAPAGAANEIKIEVPAVVQDILNLNPVGAVVDAVTQAVGVVDDVLATAARDTAQAVADAVANPAASNWGTVDSVLKQLPLVWTVEPQDGKCPAGYYVDGALCRRCAQGHVRAIGDDTCKICPPGTFADMQLQECRPCATGNYAYWHASTRCLWCLPGTYADQLGSTKCKRCPDGTHSGYQADKCI